MPEQLNYATLQPRELSQMIPDANEALFETRGRTICLNQALFGKCGSFALLASPKVVRSSGYQEMEESPGVEQPASPFCPFRGGMAV